MCADNYNINNMNKKANDDDTTCAFTDMNCVGDTDETCAFVDVNCGAEKDETCSLENMNCED